MAFSSPAENSVLASVGEAASAVIGLVCPARAGPAASVQRRIPLSPAAESTCTSFSPLAARAVTAAGNSANDCSATPEATPKTSTSPGAALAAITRAYPA